MENKKSLGQIVGGILFAGFMFIGMGLGFYFQQIVVGLFIGMGAGFVAMGLTWAILKNK